MIEEKELTLEERKNIVIYIQKKKSLHILNEYLDHCCFKNNNSTLIIVECLKYKEKLVEELVNNPAFGLDDDLLFHYIPTKQKTN